MTGGIRITIDDFGRAGIGHGTARRILERNGVDYRLFLDSGCPAADLHRDELVLKAIAQAMIREGRVDDAKVRLQDVRSVFLCSRGTREFCKEHGLDYMEILGEGIPVACLLGMEDERVRRAVSTALERTARERI